MSSRCTECLAVVSYLECIPLYQGKEKKEKMVLIKHFIDVLEYFWTGGHDKVGRVEQ